MYQVKNGFLIVELVIYSAITCAALVFFLMVLRHTLVFRHATATIISHTLYHYHSFHLLCDDCARAHSIQPSNTPDSWDLIQKSCDDSWQPFMRMIQYSIRTDGLYRSVYISQVLQSTTYLGPKPTSLMLIQRQNHILIRYQVVDNQTWSIEVPWLCAV
jgi:hypothetical protein